jgi:hypothetical protein
VIESVEIAFVEREENIPEKPARRFDILDKIRDQTGQSDRDGRNGVRASKTVADLARKAANPAEKRLGGPRKLLNEK